MRSKKVKSVKHAKKTKQTQRASRTEAPKILLADDLVRDGQQSGRSSAAFACAEAIAQRLAIGVDHLHVDTYTLSKGGKNSPYRKLVEDYLVDQKKRLAEYGQKSTVRFQSRIVAGTPPADKILKIAGERGKYELLVCGTHGRKGLARVILGSVAEELVRHSPIPVLTVGPIAQERGAAVLNGGQSLKILVPTMLAAQSARAEKYALGLAARLGAEVILLHSLKESLHPVLQTAFLSPGADNRLGGYFDELTASAQKRLTALANKLSTSKVRVTPVLDTETFAASEAILKECAKPGVALVVMGTHGRNLVTGAFLGRTARGVILESVVPVISVRSQA